MSLRAERRTMACWSRKRHRRRHEKSMCTRSGKSPLVATSSFPAIHGTLRLPSRTCDYASSASSSVRSHPRPRDSPCLPPLILTSLNHECAFLSSRVGFPPLHRCFVAGSSPPMLRQSTRSFGCRLWHSNNIYLLCWPILSCSPNAPVVPERQPTAAWPTCCLFDRIALSSAPSATIPILSHARPSKMSPSAPSAT